MSAAGTGVIIELFKNNQPILMVSDGPYTDVTFSNGKKHCVSYCQKEIKRRFGVELTKVNRKVSAAKGVVRVAEDAVWLNRRKYKYSKRMKKNWVLTLLIFGLIMNFTRIDSYAQTAVNDKFFGCTSGGIVFRPLSNDVGLASGSIINDFTPPTFGLLRFVNDGTYTRMKYTFTSGVDSTGFSYRAKTPSNVLTNYATVSIVGRNLVNLGGTYAATAQQVFGCRILTRGRVVFEPTARYQFEVTNSMTLLPGTEIKAGAVVLINVKQ